MYNNKVMEIFQNPKNVGELKGANGIGTVGNAACGDIMKLYIKVNENEVITDASFKTFGCAAAIVSSSVATEMIKGKKIADALKLENQQILDYLGGLPDNKIHCSILAKEALEAAVKDYRKKMKQGVKNAENIGNKAKVLPPKPTFTKKEVVQNTKVNGVATKTTKTTTSITKTKLKKNGKN